MKRSLYLMLALLAATAAIAADAEDDAIVAVVNDAYVRGVHIERDPELMRAGMHETFVMFTQTDKGLVAQVSRDGWIERVSAARAKEASEARKDPKTVTPATRADITVLDRAGKAAVVKVALFRGRRSGASATARAARTSRSARRSRRSACARSGGAATAAPRSRR